MLLHLFQMQDDRNSAWTSLYLKRRLDESPEPRPISSQRHCYSSPLHCTATSSSHGSMGFSQHKNAQGENVFCTQDIPDKHRSAFASRPCHAQPKSEGYASPCHQGAFDSSFPSSIKSEPATRSNSVDCEKDLLNFAFLNATKCLNLDERSRLSELASSSGTIELTLPFDYFEIDNSIFNMMMFL